MTTDNIGGMELGFRIVDILGGAGVTKEHPAYKEAFGMPQEFALIQSAEGEEAISPTEEPYRIMALSKGASLEDVREARKRIGLGAHGSYFGLALEMVRISVEATDSEGRTFRRK